MAGINVNPWRQVIDVTLIILCWLTVSPLMVLPNRHYDYLDRKKQNWLILFSPFTWGILTMLFLIIGVPILTNHVPSFASTIKSFPEFTGALDGQGGWWQLVLVVYFLPAYSFCVLVLFASMALTGWTYREASVYICEYFEPWFCIAVAIAVIVTIIVKMRRMNQRGKLLSLIPIGLECLMMGYNYCTFQNRMAKYVGMNIDQMFNSAVEMLVALGEKTHTGYIAANIFVYILPLVAILLIAYLSWIICVVSKKNRQIQ